MDYQTIFILEDDGNLDTVAARKLEKKIGEF